MEYSSEISINYIRNNKIVDFLIKLNKPLGLGFNPDSKDKEMQE